MRRIWGVLILVSVLSGCGQAQPVAQPASPSTPAAAAQSDAAPKPVPPPVTVEVSVQTPTVPVQPPATSLQAPGAPVPPPPAPVPPPAPPIQPQVSAPANQIPPTTPPLNGPVAQSVDVKEVYDRANHLVTIADPRVQCLIKAPSNWAVEPLVGQTGVVARGDGVTMWVYSRVTPTRYPPQTLEQLRSFIEMEGMAPHGAAISNRVASGALAAYTVDYNRDPYTYHFLVAFGTTHMEVVEFEVPMSRDNDWAGNIWRIYGGYIPSNLNRATPTGN